MATYKVWLTVKDRYGCTKELDSGNIEIAQDKLTDEDLNEIKESLPVYVPDVTQDNMLVYTLEHGETKERLEFDIDKSNDWNCIDNTVGSSYIWEPMQ
jgi:hypothetical protein